MVNCLLILGYIGAETISPILAFFGSKRTVIVPLWALQLLVTLANNTFHLGKKILNGHVGGRDTRLRSIEDVMSMTDTELLRISVADDYRRDHSEAQSAYANLSSSSSEVVLAISSSSSSLSDSQLKATSINSDKRLDSSMAQSAYANLSSSSHGKRI